MQLGFSLLLLVVGIAVIVGLALMARKNAVAAVAAALCLLMLFAGGRYAFHLSGERRLAVETIASPTETAAGQDSAVWADIDFGQFTADVYPARTSAVSALAHLARTFVEVLPVDRDLPRPDLSAESIEVASDGAERETRSPLSVVINGHGIHERHRNQMLSEFISHLQDAPSGRQIRIADNADAVEEGAELAPGSVLIALRDSEFEIEPTTANPGQHSGRVECDVKTAGESRSFAIRYIDKPWVESFDAYISAHPHRRLVVGYSGNLASSETEARRRALWDGQSEAQMVVNGVLVRPDDSHVIDRFAQKLSRPYGDVWREAVLMDVSLDRMADTIAAAGRHAERVERSRMSTGVGLVLLFGTASLIGVMLNHVTQGYYRGGLAIGGIVAVVLTIAVAVLILANFSAHRVVLVQEAQLSDRPSQTQFLP